MNKQNVDVLTMVTDHELVLRACINASGKYDLYIFSADLIRGSKDKPCLTDLADLKVVNSIMYDLIDKINADNIEALQTYESTILHKLLDELKSEELYQMPLIDMSQQAMNHFQAIETALNTINNITNVRSGSSYVSENDENKIESMLTMMDESLKELMSSDYYILHVGLIRLQEIQMDMSKLQGYQYVRKSMKKKDEDDK